MEILTFLNSMSPLGVIALLAYVVYLQVKNRRTVEDLGTNHLSEVVAALVRIETKLTIIATDITWLRAKHTLD